MQAPNNFAVAMFLRNQHRLLGDKYTAEQILEMHDKALPWGVDRRFILGMLRAVSAKELALAAGFKNMNQLASYTGNSRQTLNNWFRFKPVSFDYVLLGAHSVRYAYTF